MASLRAVFAAWGAHARRAAATRRRQRIVFVAGNFRLARRWALVLELWDGWSLLALICLARRATGPAQEWMAREFAAQMAAYRREVLARGGICLRPWPPPLQPRPPPR